jgi:hypothetical protein
MSQSTFDLYLELRQRFRISRELAVETLAWAEPLARKALGVHAQRDQMDLGEALQYLPVMTSAEDNGGWGELMPAWFKPYERPLPIYILDNWALPALIWREWLVDVGQVYNAQNLLKIILGGDLLIPFLPKVQGGGRFLRHGAFTVYLAILWLGTETRDVFLEAVSKGADLFAEKHRLRERDDLQEFIEQVEFEAFFIAEGSKIGGDEQVRAFLANDSQYQAYADLFGALCFSLAALHDWYGLDWESWIFQKVNLDYRLARFGLEAWEKWLGRESDIKLP